MVRLDRTGGPEYVMIRGRFRGPEDRSPEYVMIRGRFRGPEDRSPEYVQNRDREVGYRSGANNLDYVMEIELRYRTAGQV